MKAGAGSRLTGPVILRSWKGLFSPRKLIRGEWGMQSLPIGGGIAMRGVRAVLEISDSRYIRIP